MSTAKKIIDMQPRTGPARKNAPSVDVSALRITDEPYSDGRSKVVSKYDAFFRTVRPNCRIVCPEGKAGGVASSLRIWLGKNGHKGADIRSRERCDDGQGGVWWVVGDEKRQQSKKAEPAAAPKTVWRGLGAPQ